MIKKNILVFLVTSLSILYAQQYWIQKTSPTAKSLTRIQFVDTLHGWASGDSGIVIHTTNSGQNWVIQNTGFSGSIEDLYFVNRNLGWAVGNDVYFSGTKILKTTNGGLNWQISVYPDTSIVFSAIYFLDSLSGFLSGFTGQIYKTTNGALNWASCSFDTTGPCPIYLFPKFSISFLNSQTGYMCGGIMDIQGIIWKTSDSGQNWFTYCIAPEPIKRVKVLYPNKIISTGGDLEYGCSSAQSVDGGNNWLYETTGLFGIGTALAFRTPAELWIPLSIDTSWALSLDSGGYQKPWYRIGTPNQTILTDAMFVTPSFGWGCGSNGVLVKYNPNIIGISGNGYKIPNESTLFQNYPNPFNPATTISYVLKKKSFVKITLYDLLGKELKKHIEGIKEAGHHKYKFYAFSLASGIYIYKIEAVSEGQNPEVYTQSKKLVVLK
jgi:photosystem II stability/assembly factor-like uncharacterized protein